MVPTVEPLSLRVCDVRKTFGSMTVLDGVHLDIPQGTVTAVLGPSGGGKTTLLRIIAGFEHADSGSVEIDGNPIVAPGIDVPAERRRVGVVPQEGALFPHLDVTANVGFGLRRGPTRASRISEVLDLVGLAGFERRRPHQLSGGEQHRVALARALAPSPSLVMLDEPFSSLDTGLRAQVREEVLVALRAAHTTAVIVTHDQLEALSIADQVAVLLDGRIAQCADPAVIYESPATLGVATFVGDAIVLPGQAYGGRVRCAFGDLPIRLHGPTSASPSGPVHVVIRPEQLEIGDVGAPGIAGTVVSRSFFGHDGTIRVALDDGTHVTARLHTANLPRRADHVTVNVVQPVSAFAVA